MLIGIIALVYFRKNLKKKKHVSFPVNSKYFVIEKSVIGKH